MPTSLEDMDDATRDSLAALSKKLSENPKTRRAFQVLLKADDPNLPIPEIDTENRILGAVKPYADKLNELEKRELERNAAENIRAKRDGLRNKGYTQEQIDSIEKLMIEKQIPSHDTAARFYDLETQTATPSPSHIHQITMPVSGKDIKAAGDIKKWARNEAHQAIEDIKAGRVKLGANGYQ